MNYRRVKGIYKFVSAASRSRVISKTPTLQSSCVYWKEHIPGSRGKQIPPASWVSVGKSVRSSVREHFMYTTWKQGHNQITASKTESGENNYIPWEFTAGSSDARGMLCSMWIINWKTIPFKENRRSNGNAMPLDAKAKPEENRHVRLLQRGRWLVSK